MGKQNKNWQNRPQQGGQNNNNQQQQKAATIEQKPTNAPLATIADTAPQITYASEADVSSLLNLIGKLEDSAQMFGDVAVEATQSIIAPIRALITTVGSISAEDQKQIDAIKAEIEMIEMSAGARSIFAPVADAAYKALEEGTDPLCIKWKENQELISTFAGEETQQMTADNFKEAIDSLAFQQVMSLVFCTIDIEGCPNAMVSIDEELTATYNENQAAQEEPQPEAQPQIAAV